MLWDRAARLAALGAAAALVLGGAGGVGGVAPVGAAASGPQQAYIVRATHGALPTLLDHLAASHVDVVRTVALVDAAVVRVDAGAAAALAADPSVAAVTRDEAVQLESSSYDASSDVNSMTNLAALVGADKAWAAGDSGQGVDVALVDSGVSPVQGLAGAGQVLMGPDLSNESGAPQLRGLDTFGHGTFMAGVIAGHDPGVVGDPDATDAYQGIAPGARIVSVKVADAFGRTDVSQVIAGIGWVVQHAHDGGRNIRVLNLSFGTSSRQAYTLDPLSYAAEVAWQAGIVVVVSSGNVSGRLADPASDPFVVAVGASDTEGTATPRDDTVADFTATGTYKRRVDLLAPGVHVQGLRVPGSFVDIAYGGTGRLGDRFFRGSGTSQAAAITSGVAALILSRRPNLTPDQVKGLLLSTADRLPRAGYGQGAGMVDADGAALGGWPGPADQQDFTPSTGGGSLAASSGTSGSGTSGSGSTGASWAGASWAGASWAGASWAGVVWDGASWDGASWDGASWDGASWDGASWDGASWDGASWDAAGWLGESWS